ncbi:MAG: methyltransferase domain-containing protein [Bacteroidetes bacterium]|nr:methyltransferase domain-containing protein [Bacteroidota bacterium]
MKIFPETFIQNMQTLLPNEAESFFVSQQLAPPISLRLHPIKSTPDLFEDAKKVDWCNLGRYLNERPIFTYDPHFHAGAYYVQEAGSMLLEKLLLPFFEENKNLVVLDLCAAPGGKSTHLLSMMNEDGILVSNELIPTRNKILRQNIAKWGFSNCIVTQNKAEDFSKSKILFDVILVDAPCSGEGLFRKDEHAISEWSMDQVNVCSIRQSQILEAILPVLKPGGLLLYSTCTYEESENDLQIERIIQEYDLQMITPIPPQGIVSTKYGWQAYPHKVKSEGFYCCLLQKNGERKENNFSIQKITSKKSNIPDLSAWTTQDRLFNYVQQQDFIYATTNGVQDLTKQLSYSAYIRMSGILMGEIKGKDFIPSAELSLSNSIHPEIPTVQLNLDQALQYLCGDPLQSKCENSGWHLIKYEHSILGWAKKCKSLE